MRIGIDAMGGDKAPGEPVKGALAARKVLGPDDKIVLIGDSKAIQQHLAGQQGWEEFIELRHASEVIGMADSPVEVLRAKPDSSIAVMAEMHRAGDIDACVSAGNTGACVAAAQMRLRRLKGVQRPGIAIITPTHHGPVAICDVGANVNCRPQHLHQYGVMASVYISMVAGIENPRVGLLSVGEEAAKGNELVKQTRELMKNDSNINFIGNVEGRDLFSGACDVMVCEGFVGNVVLKLMEGMAIGVIKGIFEELVQAAPELLGKIMTVGSSLKKKYDFNEYGGAPLLGVSGVLIICHGASDANGIKNAIGVASTMAKHQMNQKITELLSKKKRTANA